MQNGSHRRIRLFSLAEQAKRTVVIGFYFGMSVIGNKFILFRDHCDILKGLMTMLEATSTITWDIGVTLLNRSLIILSYKR
jgi:hypothetical protein